MTIPDVIISFCLGIGLAAASGFRIFLPLLMANLASLAGWHKFDPGFAWMGTWLSFSVLLVATAFEIAAYYIPWFDNLLDQITLPLVIAAGSLLTVSVLGNQWPPVITWALGIIAGGGTAGLIHAGTGFLRIGSSVKTGGMANPLLATAENGLSFGLSLFSFLFPLAIAILIFFVLFRIMAKMVKKKGTT